MGVGVHSANRISLGLWKCIRFTLSQLFPFWSSIRDHKHQKSACWETITESLQPFHWICYLYRKNIRLSVYLRILSLLQCPSDFFSQHLTWSPSNKSNRTSCNSSWDNEFIIYMHNHPQEVYDACYLGTSQWW